MWHARSPRLLTVRLLHSRVLLPRMQLTKLLTMLLHRQMLPWGGH